MKNNRSWCYKQGFKAGLQIARDNLSQHGWLADEENKKAIRGFQRQIDQGNLTKNQVEWRQGVIDSIRYTYSQHGAQIMPKEESPFEKRLRIHDYGEKKPYDGTKWWE